MRTALWLLVCAVAAVSVTAEQCSWMADNATTSGGPRGRVTCRLRTLDGEATDFNGFPAEGTLRVRVQCSDVLLYESTVQAQAFQRFHQLQDLFIDCCKLLQIPSGAFDGLRDLKRLAINTRNGDWGSSKSLELTATSLSGLKELHTLDLADNNMRAVPSDLVCGLGNLQTLNLTRNRIRSVERLGFGETAAPRPDCPAGGDLLALDVSHNELRAVPEGSGLSRLRRLQHLDLRANNISEISGDALAGLVSLRVLDLSNNRMDAMPQGLFAGCRELRELHLQNNSLFSLAKGLFHRLEQLLVLDLSNNQLTSGHVDAGTFTGLIRLIILNLSHNALTRIDGRTFKDLFFLQILDLRNNSIGFIEDNAFLPLYNLHTLNLAENRLNTIGPLLFNGLFVLSKLTLNNNLIVSVDPQAFRNCSDLKELDLSSNALQEVPEALRELSFLKTLDLGENQISEFRNGSFRNLQQLTGLRLIDNNIGNLSRGMLWDLPSLQVLNLAKNKVQSIERGTFDRNTQLEAIRLDENFLTDINGVFATLASLLWLNLSENHLVWFDYAFIPSNLKWLDIHGNFIESLANYYKIQDEIRVKTLDASHNRITDISAMSIPNSVELLFINNNFISAVQTNTFMDKASLARVDMYANEISRLELNALRLSPVPANRSLPEFYVGGNPFDCDCSMEWLQLINNMTASRSYPRVMDLDNVMCRMAYSRGLAHMPLAAAKPSDFLCPYETHCFALCHCCDFDACDCEMTCPHNCSCYHDQTWNTNVVDCSGQGVSRIPHRVPMDATELYLDGNDLKELQDHVFIGRKNLRVLFVNGSGVETIQNRTFNGLNALQTLHLEDNRIQELQGFEFEHLSHLRELYLHNNLIKHIGNLTLLPLRSLEVLRLDGNRLVTFPVWQLALNAKLTALTLGNNQWSCRCKFLQELAAWINDNAHKVLDAADVWCYNTESRPPQRRALDLNSTACSDYYAGGSVIDGMFVSDYLPMVAVTLALFVLVLVALVLWFAFRDLLRVWFYSRYGVRLFKWPAGGAAAGGAAGGKHGAAAEDRDKLYDGYVCYSPKDEEFVVQSIAAELENGSPGFQLCLHYRDLPHAAYLQHAAPAVLEAAEASRRVILVLTRNFMQTEWSRFELRQALHEALKGRVFKLVLVEEGPALPEAHLDPDLRPYLKTGARVRWGEKRFWQKLRYAMPAAGAPRAKINANYRRNINNYTLDSSVVVSNGGTHAVPHHHHHQHSLQRPAPDHHHLQQQYQEKTASPAAPRRQSPPAYSAEHDDANYSSATTATPSPRPARRHHHQQHHQEAAPQQPAAVAAAAAAAAGGRPVSDHIYSSIDSDYSTLERGGSGRGVRAPPSWRPGHAVVNSNGVQAYLV